MPAPASGGDPPEPCAAETVAWSTDARRVWRTDGPRAQDAEAGRARRLALSRDLLATLLDQAPDAFVALSPGGAIVAWNEAAERLFGRSAAQAVGMAAEAVFPIEITGEIRRLSERALSGQAFAGHKIVIPGRLDRSAPSSAWRRGIL